MSIHWPGRVLLGVRGLEKRSHRFPDGCGESAEDQAEEVEVAGAWAWLRELVRRAGGNCLQTYTSGSTQQSSYKSIMARVLLLAASAVALRPTLPRRSRTTTRAALTMHDYDYDAGSSAYIKLSTAESWPSRHRRDACTRLTD